MRIEVVYALASVQDTVSLELPAGASAGEAAAASGLPARHGLAGANLRLGIGGREVKFDHRLRDGDRVEILRPLALDPNEARRLRARASHRRRG
jgi:hypothetical protein